MNKNKKTEWQVEKILPKNIYKEHPDISKNVLQLLFNRKIFSLKESKEKRKEKIEYFLHPSYEELFNSYLMKDLEKAVIRIKKALKNKEKIAIFGDYDADGVTSTVLLYEVFKHLGCEAMTYIPHREEEGYGLNNEALKKIAKKNVKLLITVDCGIRNIDEVKQAKKLGMDIIITDHHEVPKKKKSKEDMLPKAYAVINPNQAKCHYPFKRLAGVGVAYKLAQGLLNGSKEGQIFLKWLLDLVVIGTIGDCVPLISENRIFAKYGFIVFKKTRRVGILELKKVIKNGKENDLGYYLAPRLNAAGRMDHANWAYKLLITRSKIEGLKLVRKIEELNKIRQEETSRIFEEARCELKFLGDQKIIILAKENWPSSITGIVAGRLADQYKKPALVIEKKGEFSKGSARSYQGFDITKALSEISFLFLKVGGHKQAAGFLYKTKHQKEITEKLLKIAKKSITKDKKEKISIDLKLKLKDISHDFFNQISLLGPFGEGNAEPLFLAEKARILEKRKVGSGNHLKIRIEQDGKIMDAIAFRKGSMDDFLKEGQYIDFIFKLAENYYLGFKTMQIEIIDLKLSKE